MTHSSEAFSPEAGGLEVLCASNPRLFFCPLVFTQLRVVVCPCQTPWECRYANAKFQREEFAKGIKAQCSTSSKLADSARSITPGCCADLPFPSDVSSGVPPCATATRAEAVAESVRAFSDIFFSSECMPCDQFNCSPAHTASSSCRDFTAQANLGGQYGYSEVDTRRRGNSVRENSRRRRSGSPAEPPRQPVPPCVTVNFLCCTRWKHTFTLCPHAYVCRKVYHDKAGRNSYGCGCQKLSGPSASASEGGVVCGLLLYEGQRFFEGRLSYDQLNGGICWNEAAWKDLYHALTFRDSLPSAGGSAQAAGDSVSQPVGVAGRETASRAISRDPLCMAAAHGKTSFVVLHRVGSRELRESVGTEPCATSLPRKLHGAAADESQHVVKEECSFFAEPSVGHGFRLCRHHLQKCFARLDAVTPTRLNSRRSGDRDGHRDSHMESLDGGNSIFRSTGSGGSTATGRHRLPLRQQNNSGSPVYGESGTASRKGSALGVPCASGGQSADSYTLSLVMQVGAAPCQTYVLLTEPIQLQPLEHPAGVAKLSTALLLMQQLHLREQRHLHEQYTTCLKALRKNTEELAVVTARQQKRENDLLTGACMLLIEKKRKLEALQRRVVLLEREVGVARTPDGTGEAVQRGLLQQKGGGELKVTAVDRLAATHSSDMSSKRTLRKTMPSLEGANNEVAHFTRIQACDSGTVFAQTASQSCGRQTPRKVFPCKGVIKSSRVLSEKRNRPKDNDIPKCELPREKPGGFFIVKDRRIFPAAFACIRAKKEYSLPDEKYNS